MSPRFGYIAKGDIVLLIRVLLFPSLFLPLFLCFVLAATQNPMLLQGLKTKIVDTGTITRTLKYIGITQYILQLVFKNP